MAATLRTATAFLLAASISIAAHAQPRREIFRSSDRLFETVGDQQSIPGLIVAALAQDVTGFVWIGTHEGLVRHDGYRFDAFRHDPTDDSTLSDNLIRAIEGGEDGSVWAATSGSGVSVYSPATGKFTRLRAGKTDGTLWRNESRAFARGTGGMWVGTLGGLQFVSYGSLAVKRYELPTDNTRVERAVTALARDRKGNVWIGTQDGLFMMNREGRIARAQGDVANWSRGKPIHRLFVASDGAIWIGIFGGGLAVHQPWSHRLLLPPQDESERVASIAEPTTGEIWIATQRNGIEIRNGATGELISRLQHDPSVDETVDSDRVASLMLDRSGTLWVGFWGSGLNRHFPSAPVRILGSSMTRTDTLSHRDVGCVLESRDGSIWIGTRGKGVDVFRDGVRVQQIGVGSDALADGDVPALAETDDGAIWIGTGPGVLHRFDRTNGRLQRYPLKFDGKLTGAIALLRPADQGKLWIGTTSGLGLFDTKTGEIVRARFADGNPIVSQISEIAEDVEGTTWVATHSALAVRRSGADTFLRLSRDEGTEATLSSSTVLSVLVDRQQRLWVGTASGLDRLTRFDGKTATFDNIAKRLQREGARSENLFEDTNGRIWIDGEVMFDPISFAKQELGPVEGGGRVLWRGAATKLRGGELLFGGTDGLLVIDPARVSMPAASESLAVTALRIDGVPRPFAGGGIRLEPGSKSVSVEFSALDYAAPLRNRYAFRLRPYESRWNETDATRRSATYSALPPGNYTFEIRTASRAGTWAPKPLIVHMTVLPAFHQTRWFKSLIAVLIAVALYLAYRLRSRRLRARAKELEALVAVRTAELEQEHRLLEQRNADLATAYTRIEEASLTDPLTQLRNRRFLDQTLNADLEIVSRHYEMTGADTGSDLVFLIVDIDHFKSVNDNYGHAAGDAVLKGVAEILRKACRPSDYVVRWGGEEFLIVCRFVERRWAGQIAEKLRSAIADAEFELAQGVILRGTCSIGFASYPLLPQQPRSVGWGEVVSVADTALYGAKRNGRNCWLGVEAVDVAEPRDLVKRFSSQPELVVSEGELRVVSAAPIIEKPLQWH